MNKRLPNCYRHLIGLGRQVQASLLLLSITSSVMALERIDVHAVAEQWWKYKAPPGIQKFMEKEQSQDLAECIENYSQMSKKEKRQRRGFTAVRLKTGPKAETAFLIVSPARCWNFRGAHARRVWMLRVTKERTFQIILEAATDAIVIADTHLEEYGTAMTLYGGFAHCIYIKRFRFNGNEYEYIPGDDNTELCNTNRPAYVESQNMIDALAAIPRTRAVIDRSTDSKSQR